MTIKLNYTITIPQQSPVEIPRAPTKFLAKFLDKLHPKKSENPPYVQYEDEGVWKTRIEFQKDTSHFALFSRAVAEHSKPHASLDALCEAELQRRSPGEKFKEKQFKKFKRQIAFSATNRDDMVCRPQIVDETLRRGLKLGSDEVLRTEHVFWKNSPMNGQSYLKDGQPVHLSQAIACSSDRKVENTGNLRVIRAPGESICYTGRVDSDRKVLEQASFIFFNELKSKGKGITRQSDGSYQLDYVINSMLTIPFYWHTESIIAPFPERQYIEEERKALMALQEKGFVEVEDFNNPGVKYRVKFNPMLFSRSSNVFTRNEDWLPSFITGQARSEEISTEGFASLKTLAQRSNNAKVKSCLAAFEKPMAPEVEWLTRDYLCKLLGLPMVYHCKSSTDRTSVTVAMSSALHQWMALNLPVPENIGELIDDYRFKELFAANWMAGHQVTRYARGAKGTVNGEKLNSKNLGLSLGRGIAQNPLVAKFLPERYLTDFPTAQKIKFIFLIPLLILFYLPLMLISIVRQAFGLDPKKDSFNQITQIHKIFPEKILNEASVQVGQRQLIAGGKNKGKDDNEH